MWSAVVAQTGASFKVFNASSALDNPLPASAFALALNIAADRIILFAGAVEDAFGYLELSGRHDQQHSNPQVEGAHHFALLHVPQHLHVSKDGSHRPGAIFNDRGR